MIPLWVLHSIIMIALALGTYTDFKKREVPDFLNFSLMGVGVALGLLSSVFTGSILPFVWSVVGLITGYLIGALMFYTGQWGGGDAKMLMGIGAVLGLDLRYFWVAGAELPLFFTAIVAIFLLGTVYGVGYGKYLVFTHRKEFKKAFLARIREPVMLKMRRIVIGIVLILIIIAFLQKDLLLRWMIGLLGLLIFGGFYLYVIGKLLEKVCMIKEIPVSRLTEGEWIAQDVVVKGKRICGPKDLGISNEQIATLKKLKVKKVIIKEGIPFIPGFLLGYITVIIWGNWLAGILAII